MRERARIFRLPPCPPYDVEGTESWLEEMAARGRLLEKDSIFLGFAGFEKADPAPVRYRLEAAERNVNDWDDLSGAPDPEAEELNADFGWEYVARRGQFFIYRSLSAESPELHTDPRVQALAVKALEKRRTIRVLNILLVLGVHLFSVLLRKSLLLAAAEAGLPITLFTLLLTLWLLADAARELAHLGRLKKRLAAGEPLRHDADWRKGQSAYFGRRLARLLLFLLWLLLLLRLWAWEAAGTGKTALADYRGALPFADMRDFAAGDFRVTMGDLRYSYVIDRSGVFLRRRVRMAETARVLRPDGTVLDGGLYVTYYEARWEWLAAALGRELLRTDRAKMGRRWRGPVEHPDFGLDEASAYRSDLHLPCVVLRQGRKVLWAMFYQTGPGEEKMPPEEWAGILADSIR